MGNKMMLILPKFFGYERYIQCAFEDLGFVVDTILLSHSNTLFERIIKRLPYMADIKENLEFLSNYRILNKNYDIILVVRGDLLSPLVVEHIKKENSKAKMILYLWDSVRENIHVKKILPYFDIIKSFDMQDCMIYGFKHLPLFYVKNYISDNRATSNFKYAFSFIGRDHTDRYNILRNLKCQADKIGYDTYIYLRTSKLGYYKRKINNLHIKKSEFKYIDLSPDEIHNIYNNSKCVVDIELPVQNGLTMRTFEVLANSRKLITTNTNILDYNFYHPNNILVIDRNAPKLDISFLDSPFVEMDCFANYSIDKWALNVIN